MPHAVFHFVGSKRPLGASLFFWQIHEWSDIRYERFHASHKFALYMVHKACADFPGIEQIFTLIVPYDYSFERMAGSVAANDELLALVDLIFDPGSATLARLVKRILLLGAA